MPSAQEKAIASQAMSANYNLSSPNYTSRIISEEFGKKVNQQFSHYGSAGKGDYVQKLFDKVAIQPKSDSKDYVPNRTPTLNRLKDSYQDPVREFILNSVYHRG